MSGSHSPRLLLALLLAACFLIALPSASSAAARAQRDDACANTNLRPAADNLPLVRQAILCLHNRDRRANGLAPLKENANLREAAGRHSGRMVADRFFSHDSPAGTMVERILRTGYASNSGWSLGENLAWGTGSLATAGQTHRAWMDSPGHKANILRRQYREIGIGIAVGVPVHAGAKKGATYTTDFGVRR